jgi:DNA modification methylase
MRSNVAHLKLVSPGIATDVWSGVSKAGASWSVHQGDSRHVLPTMPPERFDSIITSPPYYCQRDYDSDEQIGLEETIAEYVEAIAGTMDQAKRVLKKDGTLFLNLGDTYYSGKGEPKGRDKKNWARRFGLRAVDKKGLGVPKKTAIGIPWRVALEMINRGWVLRSPVVWKRKRPVPEPSARDRPWRSYEMIFIFVKATRYYFNREGLDGDEDVWIIHSQSRSTKNLQSAYFPDELVRRCLAVGCPPGGEILDPFAGSGTALRVAAASGHNAVGIDLNPTFCSFMVRDLTAI